MTDISLWGYSMRRSWLSGDEAEYLNGLPEALPALEWVWGETDRVWRQLGLDNRRPLADQPVAGFYRHPVWLMNGVFTALDPASARHREAIARSVVATGARTIADFGGGFGELARTVARFAPDADISIIEPYPSRTGLELSRREPGIRFAPHVVADCYDAIVAQDVLEHVEDPVGLAHQIADSVRAGGVVVFANCFYPVIQCHLPSTFHLRHTFPIVMRALGLRYAGRVEGAPHAQIFRRTGRLHPGRARTAERLSRLAGAAINRAFAVMSRIKHLALRR